MKWVETRIGEGPDMGLARIVRRWSPPYPAPPWQRVLQPCCAYASLQGEVLRRRAPLLEVFPRPVLEADDLHAAPASDDEVVELLREVVRETLRQALLGRLDDLLSSMAEIPSPAPQDAPAAEKAGELGRASAPKPLFAAGGAPPAGPTRGRREGSGALSRFRPVRVVSLDRQFAEEISQSFKVVETLLREDPDFRRVRFDQELFLEVVEPLLEEDPLPAGDLDSPEIDEWRERIYRRALPHLVDEGLQRELQALLLARLQTEMRREGPGRAIARACAVCHTLLGECDRPEEAGDSLVWQLVFNRQAADTF